MGAVAAEQVWAIADAELKDARLLTLLALADAAGDDGQCRRSIEELAKRVGVSDRQVQRAVQWLEAHDYVKIIEKGNGRANVTLYLISIKGDILTPFTSLKGDINVTLYPLKRVTLATKKGDIKGDIGDIKGDIYSHARSGWLVDPLPSTRKKKKPTNQPPAPARLPEMKQLALDLITDGEVGIEYEAAKILASKLPALEIFRAVDGWLDDRERGELRKPSAVLFKRLDALAKHPPKRPPETVKLSSDFLGSDLFRRHRLPDELLAAPRDRRYNRPEDYTDIDLDSEQRRRKYRPDKYADIILG